MVKCLYCDKDGFIYHEDLLEHILDVHDDIEIPSWSISRKHTMATRIGLRYGGLPRRQKKKRKKMNK